MLSSACPSSSRCSSLLPHHDAQVDGDEDGRDDEHEGCQRGAEPDPAGLTDDVLCHERGDELEPVASLVDDPDQVEGAQRLDDGDDQHDDVDGRHHGEHDAEEGLALVRPVDLRRLAQRRVHTLEPRQVQEHDVAGLLPRRRHECGPEVEPRVAVPVDGAAGQTVDEALVLAVDQLPDEADQREGQHDRQVDRRLVDPRPADLPVEQDGEEDAERRRDEEVHGQPDEVVLHRGPERRVDRDDVDVVLQADELDRAEGADPVPVRERQDHRADGREPDQPDEQERRHHHHEDDDEPVQPAQLVDPPVATALTRAVSAGGRGGPRVRDGHRISW